MNRRNFLTGLSVLTFSPISVSIVEGVTTSSHDDYIRKYATVYGSIGVSSKLVQTQQRIELEKMLDQELVGLKKDFLRNLTDQDFLNKYVLPFAKESK